MTISSWRVAVGLHWLIGRDVSTSRRGLLLLHLGGHVGVHGNGLGAVRCLHHLRHWLRSLRFLLDITNTDEGG